MSTDTKDPLILELQSLSLSEQMNGNNTIDSKKDQNNNNNPHSMATHHNPFNNPNPMQSNNHNYNGNQRKFHSRYFNNRKDRPMTNNRNPGQTQGQGNFRHYNNSNHNNNDYGKNKKNGNNFNNRDRHNQHHQQSVSNTRINSPVHAATNDQSNQTSPNANQVAEADVTPPTTFSNRNYQQQQTPTVPYFVGGEGCEYSQNPSGYYIFSQPTTPQPQQFGLYLTAPVPGPQTQLSTPTPTNPNCPNGPPFSAYLGHPAPVIGTAVAPGPVQQPYFASSEIANSYGGEPPFDSISGYPPYMSYPCPFFYSPTNTSGNPAAPVS